MKLYIYIAIAILAVAVAAGCGGGGGVAGVPDTVATVNGKAVSSADYLTEAEKISGRDALTNVIKRKIINEWAEELGVAPTKEQIDKQIEIMNREKMWDMMKDQIGEAGAMAEIESQVATANIAEKILKISDDEIKSAYEMRKPQIYVRGARKFIEYILTDDKKRADDVMKAAEGGQTLAEAALAVPTTGFGPASSAKTWIVTEEKEKSPFAPPAELVAAVKKAKKGDKPVIASFKPQGPGSEKAKPQYVLFTVLEEQGPADMKFEDVKDEAKFFAAFQKSQMDPEFKKRLEEKTKKAEIKIEIPRLKDVANSVKNPPPSYMMGGPSGR